MIATLNFPTLLKFPLGGAQQELERVSRMFSGAFRKPFQGAFAAAAAEASPYIIFDSFAGTNGAALAGRTPDTANIGTTWQDIFGTSQIQSNTAKIATLGGGFAVAGINVGQSNCVVRATMRSTNGGNNFFGIAGRITDSTHWWIFSSGNGIQYIIEFNGSVNIRATQSATTTTGNWYPLEVVFNGTSITFTFNTSYVLNYSSAFNQSVQLFGFYGETTDVQCEDFSISNE